MTIALAWASFKVFRIAKRSVTMHKNPAYILYSDPSALNKWGFLYVQFRATAYYFIMPSLGYILIKALFIAFAQSSGTTQAVALVVIEAAFLIGVSILRPWMDKKTNAFNISIAAINFINAIFLLVFTSVFNQPVILSTALWDPVFNANNDTGNRYWCNGRGLLRLQCRFCLSPPGDGACRYLLRYIL